MAGLRPELRRSRMADIASSAAASAARPQPDVLGMGVPQEIATPYPSDEVEAHLILPDMQKDAMRELDGLLAMDELEIKPAWE